MIFVPKTKSEVGYVRYEYIVTRLNKNDPRDQLCFKGKAAAASIPPQLDLQSKEPHASARILVMRLQT